MLLRPTNASHDSKLYISLHNIIKVFVVAAHFLPSVILFALRKVHAPSFLDKSAIPFSKCKRASLSRAKSSRPRSSTQQVVSAQTAHLGYVPTLFAPRPNSITWSVQDNFHAPAPLDQSHRLPRDSYTRDQLRPGGANGIGLIVSGVLSGRGGQIIALDAKSKDDELRVQHQVRLGVPVEQGVGTALGGDEVYFSTPCKFGSAF